jgi:hypothetical protein
MNSGELKVDVPLALVEESDVDEEDDNKSAPSSLPPAAASRLAGAADKARYTVMEENQL